MTNTPKLEEMLKLYSKKDLWDRIQEKNKIIEELDHKIEILEKALKLTCGEELREFGIIEDTLEKHNIESIESLGLILQGMKKVKQENADLQHRLEMTEKALELACNYLVFDDNKEDELYKLVENIYDDNEYLETKINYFKEQAEKELKGE